MYKPATSSSSIHPTCGPSIYPRIGQSGHSVYPTIGRVSSFHHTSPSSSSSPGLGIKVAIKPEYRLTPSSSTTDPVVSKYIASGLSREAVPIAVSNYEDNSTKVGEFVNGYNLLRVMGFSSKNVAEALVMFDNDTDKALAHFLSSSA